MFVRGDAGIDDPDGVGQDDSGGAGNGAGDHGLDRGELLAGAAGLDGGGLEEGACPLIPVVVDKVGDADAEQRRVDARVKAGDALAGNNFLHGVAELAVGLFRLDLRAGRQGDERVCQDHGQNATARASQGVRDIVVLGGGGHCSGWWSIRTGITGERMAGRLCSSRWSTNEKG